MESVALRREEGVLPGVSELENLCELEKQSSLWLLHLLHRQQSPPLRKFCPSEFPPLERALVLQLVLQQVNRSF